MRGRCVPTACAPRRLRCWNGRRCRTRGTAACSAHTGALADAGHYRQALDVLERAHAPGEPDWRILSVQGAALDQLGRHDEAQRYYGTALRIAPDEPSVLSNLGLSYALSKDLVRAEGALRRAAGQPRVDARVRQNLALVMGLQGACPKLRGSPGPTCPRMRGTPMSPTCSRCWRSRTAGNGQRRSADPQSKPKGGDLGGDDQ
jgi:tetratricopeptide (TPR) repeat protein